MLDPIVLAVLGILVVIGCVIGLIATAGAGPRRIILDIAVGALAALAVGVPAVSALAAADAALLGAPAIGTPGPWLLPLAAYLSGALAAVGLSRFVSL